MCWTSSVPSPIVSTFASVEATHRVFLDVAVAAVDLHCLLGGSDGQAPGLQLGLGGREVERLSGVLLEGRLVREQARAASISVDMSASLAWMAWYFEIDCPKAHPLLGVGQRLVEGPLRKSRPSR